MKTIKINIDSDNRPIVEGLAQYSISLLRAQYDQCFSVLESILVAQIPENKYLEEIAEDLEQSNNIIVFDGDRGTGKTSCMLSAVNMLFEDGEKPYTNHTKLSDVKWQKLPLLEPAFFDSERNVLSLIVSRLYKDFIRCDDGTSEEDKRNILKRFVDIQNELQCMFKKQDKQDALEYLVNLSASVSLRKDLHDLINAFLHYMNKGATKLLILIDDIDLNQKSASSMIEELRKYLVLDNCIVMVSVKIEQLASILREEYLREYNEKTEDVRRIVSLRVDRYLSKLFPQRHRIHMPLPKEYLHYGLQIESARALDYKIVSGTTVEEAIPDLIYAKTRYLFYNTRKTTSYIVPRNLRNIRQMLKLLMEMRNYKDGDHDNETAINKEVFKYYFFNDWVEQNIPSEHMKFVRDLTQRTNYTAHNYLVHEFLSKLSPVVGNNQAIATNTPINYLNISLGDIFTDLRRVASLNHDFYTPEILFFIKAIYSIRLYEAYDSVTPDEVEDEQEQKKIKYYIVRKENDIVSDNYQALVAGSVFNSEVENFGMKSDLANVRIAQDKFQALVKKTVLETDSARKLQLQRLIEFLMLFISYKDSSKMNGSYRTYSTPFYKELAIDLDTDYVANIGSLIFNLSRYGESLQRFKTQKEFTSFFAEYDYTRDGTLYDDIRTFALDKRKYRAHKSEKSKIMSISCFRNMEVLEDFYETVKEWDYKPEAHYSDSLISFFRKSSEYSIYTYDRERGDGVQEPYNISFKYFSIFANLLASEPVKTEFDALFMIEKPSKTDINEKRNTGDTTESGAKVMPQTTVLPAESRRSN